MRDRIRDNGIRFARYGVLGFAFFAPISIFAYEVAWGISVLGLLVALASGKMEWRRTPLDFPLFLFFSAEVVSILFSDHRQIGLRALKGEWVLLFYFVFAQVICDARLLRRAYGLLLLSSSCAAAYAIWQTFAGQDLLRNRPLGSISGFYVATGFFDHHLTFGGSILITAVLAMILAVTSRNGGARVRFSGALLLQGMAMLASFARTAWGGFFAAVLAMMFIFRGLLNRLALVGLAAGIVLVALAPPIRDRIGTLGAFLDDPRIRLWSTALRIWEDHPICGSGLGTYARLFAVYKVPGSYMNTGNPHNETLNILAGCGLLGVAAFVFLWVRFFRTAGTAYRALQVDHPLRPLLLAGILIAIAILAGGMGQCFLLDEEVATPFWFAIAGTMVAAAEAKREKAHAHDARIAEPPKSGHGPSGVMSA
jgi:O-antigen ligase